MKKYFLIVVWLLLTLPVYPWGVTGHRAIGYVAEQYLTKKAKKSLKVVLGQESLAMVGTWMDEIRSDSTYDYAADWHWVTVPDGMTYEQAEKNPNGDVIMTIERLIQELKSKQLSPLQEAERLKMLIHLVEDIHQPLHVGRGDDQGGNDVKLKWFGSNSNLHRLWDSNMIDDTRLSYSELALSLGQPDKVIIESWQKASVRDWANESMSFRTQVYDIGNGSLGYQYNYKYFSIAKQRMLQSGVRLAGILNQIYG